MASLILSLERWMAPFVYLRIVWCLGRWFSPFGRVLAQHQGAFLDDVPASRDEEILRRSINDGST